VVAKTLAKLPQERYHRAGELAEDLRTCAKQLPSHAAQSLERTLPVNVRLEATTVRRVDADTRTAAVGSDAPIARGLGSEPGTGPPVARGVSRRFDSAEAMRRLAQGNAAPVLRKRSSGRRATATERLALGASVTIAAILALAVALG
jgi:hypothetical protein